MTGSARLVLGSIFALASLPAVAQSGELAVRVVLATDHTPIPGASVTLTNAQQLVTATTRLTDAEGWARFPVLRAGSGYAVEVGGTPFPGERRDDLRVRSNASETLVIGLGVALEERVSVRAEDDVVDLTEVGSSVRFSDEFLQQLPAPGRFYQDTLKLAPGVNDEDGDGNPNVHGARSRDFRAEVSGVSNVDPLTGQFLSRVNSESIEEMEVLPQGAGVEFGRAQGGFARILQKQGTNELQGVVSMLYRSSELDGNGAGVTQPIDPDPDFQTLEPGVQLSGPLIKDRLWFRLSHEYSRREDPVNLLGTLAVTTREQWLNSDQLTWQASPRNKLVFQYQNDPLTIEGLDVSSRVPLASSRTLERRGPTYSLTWTSPRNERLLLDGLVAYQDHEVDVVPTADDPFAKPQSCAKFVNFPGIDYGRCTNLSTGFVSGAHYESSLDQRQRATARGQATLHLPVGSQSHRFKAGMIVEEERYARDLERRPDTTMEIVRPAIGNPFGIAVTRVWLPVDTRAEAEGRNWAVYLEDQWKPLSNLAVTLGVRWDREEIESQGRTPVDSEAEAARFRAMAEAAGINLGQLDSLSRLRLRDLAASVFTSHEDSRGMREALAAALFVGPGAVRLDGLVFESQRWAHSRRVEDIYIDVTNFSPRVALAWDPWTDGKTKVFASAGRYYDKIFLAVPLVELEPAETTLTMTATLRSPVPPYVYQANAGAVEMTPLSARMVDRDLRTPYQDELSAGFEREIARETSVRLSWIQRSFRDQLQDVDVNSAPGDTGYCQVSGPSSRYVVRLAPSNGQGQTLLDPYTGRTYVDTDPGIGDGRLDDCSGAIAATSAGPLNRPDGRPDLYLQNPGWRELLLLGNFNEAEYEAFVVELLRRRHHNWQLEASYAWSRAEGDAEDFDLLLGNEQNLREDERGALSYDQRHVLKVNVGATGGPGIEFGSSVRWESGLPFSVVNSNVVDYNVPSYYPFDLSELAGRPRYSYPSGQRNDERNPSYWTVDLRMAKGFELGHGTALQLSVEVFNALNDDSLRLESRTDTRNVGVARFGRQWQLGFRLSF